MITFVILHYMVEEETKKCIETIKHLECLDKKIVVVDNASSNDSGYRLKEYYKDDEELTVILNEENSGFAKGNNIGYLYAKKHFNSDFIVILNNDIEIKDKTFVDKIYSIYEAEEFFILGPDIYSTSFEAHQSPKRLSHYSLSEIERLNEDYAKNLSIGTFFKIKCFIKRSFFLRKKVYQIRRRKIDYKKRYYNVPLHGACLIFSKKYIEKYDEAFYPKTFFYFESEILDYKCWKESLKTVYDPSIQVEHHQNVSTNVVYNNMINKICK